MRETAEHFPYSENCPAPFAGFSVLAHYLVQGFAANIDHTYNKFKDEIKIYNQFKYFRVNKKIGLIAVSIS